MIKKPTTKIIFTFFFYIQIIFTFVQQKKMLFLRLI